MWTISYEDQLRWTIAIEPSSMPIPRSPGWLLGGGRERRHNRSSANGVFTTDSLVGYATAILYELIFNV